ncbi:fibrocystin-L-like [Ambystoma mexicanum]|uniref:fibrocystin-L-like n=1 Tax=Ambystoma mexicanum TaxID=8296 RepID=UPI0037E93594
MAGGRLRPPPGIQPLQERTPSITTVVPLSGVPGSLVSIKGQFYTEAYGAFNPYNRNLRIKRVYVGGSPCELLKPNSDEPYGLSTDTVTCKMSGSYVGHHNVSLIVDQDYGRSLASSSSYFISSLNKLSMFQTFAGLSWDEEEVTKSDEHYTISPLLYLDEEDAGKVL